MKERYRWLLGCCLSALLAQSCGQQAAIDPAVVIAPNFTTTAPVPPVDLTSPSLVHSLELTNSRHTSVSLQWVFNGTAAGKGFPVLFEIEWTEGGISQDFLPLSSVQASPSNPLPGGAGFYGDYKITNLQPLSTYRVRVVPVFKSGRGFPSPPLAFTTLSAPQNYWEPIIPRRSSEVSYHRGFSDPVLTRPHLTEGVEVFASRTHSSPFGLTNDTFTDTAAWYADPPTSEAKELPSGRRGNSLTLIEGTIFMFGGRTNGYSCASVLKDTFNLGMINSRVEVYPCVTLQAEVNEVWSFNLDSYTWKYLNTSKYQSTAPPPAREQHSAGEVDGNLFIFGGKSRLHPLASDGTPILTNASDLVHGDLWRLNLQHPRPYLFSSTSPSILISEEERTQTTLQPTLSEALPLASLTPRDGYCLHDVTVTVHFEHPCITQVRMSLLGPGPLTGSPNFFPPDDGLEVVLLSNVAVNSTYCVAGNHTLVFNDHFTRDPSACCATTFEGPYKPAGKLSEFLGSTMLANWTLLVQDMKPDGLVGRLHGWEMHFVAAPCFPTYEWTNLTDATGERPSPRYDSQMVVYTSSFFIYGGRDVRDEPLQDLHRYDSVQHHWTRLSAANFLSPLLAAPTTIWGTSLSLTAWGLFQFGGYSRLPSLTTTSRQPAGGMYTSAVLVMDPVTYRWQEVPVQSLDTYDVLFGQTIPKGRYLSSMVFVPAASFEWKTKLPERALYDRPQRSYQSNYQGSLADTLVVFGGFDGSTGTARDGSQGGYFNDMWLLRLNALSVEESHNAQAEYRAQHCGWRMTAGALSAGTASCLSTVAGTSCSMRDMMLLAWCANQNQTLS